jgi:hypothetical protein
LIPKKNTCIQKVQESNKKTWIVDLRKNIKEWTGHMLQWNRSNFGDACTSAPLTKKTQIQ